MEGEESESLGAGPDAMVAQIKFVAYSVIAYIIVGMGLLGNLLNLVILTRPNLKGVMYVYLFGLAVSNLLVLLSAIPALFDISEGISGGDFYIAFYQAHMKIPMINSFMASSVYIIICMTVNRYISIYKPTQFQRIHTHKNASLSIIGSFIGGSVLHIPLCFQNTVVSRCTWINSTSQALCTTTGSTECTPDTECSSELPDCAIKSTINGRSIGVDGSEANVTCVWTSQENFAISENMVFKVYVVISEVLLRVGPILALAVLNALIIHKFLKIARKRQALKGKVNKAEISHNIYSAHSSPQPSSSQNTSSTNQTSSTTSGNGGGPHLTVPGLSGHSRTPSPEPSSGNSRDSLDFECLPEKHFENGNGSAVPVVLAAAAAPPRTRRRTLRRKTLQSAEERMLVMVLISIVVLFVCCTTPAAVLSVLYSVKFDNHLGFQVFRAVANNLELLNFALNFYIYCLCSADIRRAFVSIFNDAVSIIMKGAQMRRDTVTVQIDYV